MLVLVNYHKDTFFGIGYIYICKSIYMVGIHVQVDTVCIRREVEETLSGVYMVNIHLQVNGNKKTTMIIMSQFCFCTNNVCINFVTYKFSYRINNVCINFVTV
jgi:hypothetical protein